MSHSTRRKFLGQVAGAAIATSLPKVLQAQAGSAPARKPNILLIWSDDMRPELGCYGVSGIKTPNIDALAARSLRFNRAYVQYPLCNPSRSSILTGHYPTQTGVLDNREWWGREHPDWKTLPRWFREHGYTTMRNGKIFHDGIDDTNAWVEGGEAHRYADDDYEGIDVVANPPTAPAEATSTRQGGQPSPNPQYVVLPQEGETYGDYQHISNVIDMLGECQKAPDKPFFVACGFTNPHSPPRAPESCYDEYDVSKIPLPEDFYPHPTVPAGFPALSVPPVNTDLFVNRDASEQEAREVKRAYWAAISFVDREVGRVLKALDDLKLRDNTIIIFCADHGYHLGEKGRWSKAYSLFDVAVRVPFLISMPGGMANGKVCERNVELINMYQTCCDLCGIPAPAGIEGTSLRPLLNDPSAKWDRPAYSVVAYRDALGRSVRTEKWRYSQWVEGERGEVLFDVQNDPHELKNLATDPAHAATLVEMKALLKNLPGRTR